MLNDVAPKIPQQRNQRTLTIAEVRREFDRHGWTIRGWAQQHGISERIVYELMRGRIRGRRGTAHRAAVLLGLKDGVVE
ncbi:MAG: DNA-binding protein [Thermomonas hydrothermalis]|uniref:Gp16 family phage-associated protein n=1 Tax=Thermomonas haemolytica TaxID=141949 RepID=A0A4R3NF96_9GAMM|nr:MULTISPECIES: DNA-binding protein [Thermomonas]MCL6620390.1 DNA-binding protein [Thermomonas hydrothermalis]TCT25933.1 gp16 family phage-associated protein [Thermomonas haemolytica]TNY29070.1 DNA-binding protein [Thermomonas haemolytica]